MRMSPHRPHPDDAGMADAAMTRRALAGVLALALLAPAAVAAPGRTGWSVAELDAEAPPHDLLALSPGGGLLTAGPECGADACETVLAHRPPGGVLAVSGRIPGAPAAFARISGGAALVVTTPLSRRGLTAVDVRATGAVGRSMEIARPYVRVAAAASNGTGATGVAWLTNRLPQRLRIRTRGRDRARFGPARTIARFTREGDFGGMAVAVGPRGEVAVLWASDGALRARVAHVGERGLGPALRVGRSDTRARPAAAFSAAGTLAAIWSGADGGEEQNRTAVVRVAARPLGARGFTRARTLGGGVDAETLAFAGGAAVRAFAAGRTVNVAWTSRSRRVKLATVHANGAVTAVRALDARGVLADAAGSVTGRALITWTHDPLGPDAGARALLRVSAQRLGATEPVGPAGSRATGAVLDGTATRALVTWAADAPARWGTAERRLP